MRVFLNRPFQRFVKRENLSYELLCEAVLRADRGQLDADLGGGVIKQRIPRPGGGRSGGYRSVILYQAGNLASFVYGFAKKDRASITADELSAFRSLATLTLGLAREQLEEAVRSGALREVDCDD